MGAVSFISPHSHLLLFPSTFRAHFFSPISTSNSRSLSSNRKKKLIFTCKSNPEFADSELVRVEKICSNSSENLSVDAESELIDDDCNVDVAIEIEKLGKNYRRIRARIDVDASLQVVWSVLTDYENLSELIPGLVESRLVERRGNFAKLFQVGEQDLAFGVKFKAKGILDCYEKDLENIPFGHRRDIEFNMVEGDFQTFEGKWSIEQITNGRHEAQAYQTTLSYVVDVKPKLWLPVRLVEGPAPIQAQAWSMVLHGKALVGIAERHWLIYFQPRCMLTPISIELFTWVGNFYFYFLFFDSSLLIFCPCLSSFSPVKGGRPIVLVLAPRRELSG